MPMTRIMREFPRPDIEVEVTEFGMRIVTLRRISDAKTHVRVTNLIFPHAFTIPMSSEMTITQWHVPIDDEKHYWYAIFTSFGAPVDRDEMRRQRLALYELPDYIPRKNRTNNYGFDPHEQEDETFTGMGTDINVHDQWACESMGPIADRTREHLGQSDKAISAYRRILRNAIDAASNGHKPLMVLDAATAAKLTGPAAIDGIGPSGAWQTYWRKTDEAAPLLRLGSAGVSGKASLHVDAGRKRVLLYEGAAGLDLIAHQLVEENIRLVDLFHVYLKERTRVAVSVVSQSWLGFISPRPL
jgi:hypothetical protein